MNTQRQTLYEACELLVDWLQKSVVAAGRGDEESTLTVEPEGKYWLGRLAPEELVATQLNDRTERLEPCAVGLRFRPRSGKCTFDVHVSGVTWSRVSREWRKSARFQATVWVETSGYPQELALGREVIERAIEEVCGQPGLSGEVRCDVQSHSERGVEVTVTFVNTSPMHHRAFADTRLYECAVSVTGADTVPFLLEALPDSFRHDRSVAAYGVNCGVRGTGGSLESEDVVNASRPRPDFWGGSAPPPDLSFVALSKTPVAVSAALVQALEAWGAENWSEDALRKRTTKEHWSDEMISEARAGAAQFGEELQRLRGGVRLLEGDEQLQRCFMLMNEAMAIASKGKYSGWRAFQLGFLLANLSSIVSAAADADIVDIVWFATGGGKTETYLGLLITAALYDRMRGKSDGITAWSRFPLRMLSLQQLQRFADAMAAAELVRRKHSLPGAPFSLGFLVGSAATPNALKAKTKPGQREQWDVDDEAMPASLQVLERCPFCGAQSIEMAFNRLLWTLEHRCTNTECEWPERALPFYIVDDEIYRFLPTIVVGTLDKAASISMQASMRGLVAAPLGRCPQPGHGFTYAKRSSRPHGCLVPGCKAAAGPLPFAPEVFPPSYRLQDELHLLKDSLGAVDSHYESLFDEIQNELCGTRPKILASSATLTGYERQADVLYRRQARVFPQQAPAIGSGFWSKDSAALMRRFVAVAPRGVTLEYTVDRMLTVLQNSVRRLITEGAELCREIGIDPVHLSELISLYGTDVVYGNTLRDLDAVIRSAETQVQVPGPLNVESLTGRTQFEQIRETTARLERPEEDFYNRLHVISASSMMSHGIDIDRLNVMVVLGIPLTTAEFIQATARVGRKWPGLVFVVHKIGRERDAGIYRSFAKFVEQGDRFVEPVPISRKSRRVLQRTIAGLELARVLMIHEPSATASLALISAFRGFLRSHPGFFDDEEEALKRLLGVTDAKDPNVVRDLREWLDVFGRNIADPLPDSKFTEEASPTGSPMRSLRDVEESVPVFLNRIA